MKTNEIIPKETFTTLTDLDKRLAEAKKNIASLLGPIEEMNDRFRNSTAGVAALGQAIEECNGIINTATTAQLIYNETLSKREKLEQNITESTSQQTEQTRDFSTQLQSLNSAAGAAGDGLEVASTMLGLFANGNDRAAAAQDKLKTAMSVASGVQSVLTKLEKQSALMLGVKSVQEAAAAKACDLHTKSQGKGIVVTKVATAAQGILNAVANANPYVLLATALMTVVGGLVLFSKGAKEAADYNKIMSDVTLEAERSIQNEATQIKLLRDRLEDSTLTDQQKIATLHDLAKATNQNFDATKDLAGEQERILEGADEYLDFLLKRAMLEQLVAKIAEEQIKQKELEAKAQKEEVTGWKKYFQEFSKGLNPLGSLSDTVDQTLDYMDRKAMQKSKKMEQTYTDMYNKIYAVSKSEGEKTKENEDDITEAAKQKYKKMLEATKEFSEKEKEAVAQRLKFVLEHERDALKDIVSDTGSGYQERLTALEGYLTKQKELLKLEADRQQDKLIEEGIKAGLTREQTEEAAATRIALMWEKHDAELTAIDKEGVQMRKNVHLQYAQQLLDDVTEKLAEKNKEIDVAQRKELADLSQKYAEGKIDTEQYEKGKTDIVKKAAMERLEAEIDMLEKSLANAELSEEAQADLQKKIGDAKLRYNEHLNKELIADNERAAAQRIKTEDETAKEIEEIEKKLAELRKQLLSDVFSFAAVLIARRTEIQIRELNRESEANAEHYEQERERIDELYEAGAISKEEADARKELVDKQEEERQAELDAKKRELQIKQAKWEKAQALAKIAIDTAVALISVWKTPFMAPALISLINASAAMQIATVLATPIPEYAVGTMDHRGGPAIVGDGGRSEMIVTPSGKFFKTPARDTLVDLPRHSMVLPDFNEALRIMAASPLAEKSRTGESTARVDTAEMVKYQKESVRKLDAINRNNVRIARSEQFRSTIREMKSVN